MWRVSQCVWCLFYCGCRVDSLESGPDNSVPSSFSSCGVAPHEDDSGDFGSISSGSGTLVFEPDLADPSEADRDGEVESSNQQSITSVLDIISCQAVNADPIVDPRSSEESGQNPRGIQLVDGESGESSAKIQLFEGENGERSTGIYLVEEESGESSKEVQLVEEESGEGSKGVQLVEEESEESSTKNQLVEGESGEGSKGVQLTGEESGKRSARLHLVEEESGKGSTRIQLVEGESGEGSNEVQLVEEESGEGSKGAQLVEEVSGEGSKRVQLVEGESGEGSKKVLLAGGESEESSTKNQLAEGGSGESPRKSLRIEGESLQCSTAVQLFRVDGSSSLTSSPVMLNKSSRSVSECFSDSECMITVRPTLSSAAPPSSTTPGDPVTSKISSVPSRTHWLYNGHAWTRADTSTGRPRLPSLGGTSCDDETARAFSISSNSTISSDCSAGACVVHERRRSQQVPVRPQQHRWLQDDASIFLKRMESFRQRSQKCDVSNSVKSFGSVENPLTNCDAPKQQIKDHNMVFVDNTVMDSGRQFKIASSKTERSGAQRLWRRGGSLRLVRDHISAWRASSSLNLGKDSQKFRKELQGFLFNRKKKCSQNSLDKKKVDVSSSLAASSNGSLSEKLDLSSQYVTSDDCLKSCVEITPQIKVSGPEDHCQEFPALISGCESSLVPPVLDPAPVVGSEPSTSIGGESSLELGMCTDLKTSIQGQPSNKIAAIASTSTEERSGVVTVKHFIPKDNQTAVFTYRRNYSGLTNSSSADLSTDLSNDLYLSQDTDQEDDYFEDIDESSGQLTCPGHVPTDVDLSYCTLSQCSDVCSLHSITSEKATPSDRHDGGFVRSYSLRQPRRAPIESCVTPRRPGGSLRQRADSAGSGDPLSARLRSGHTSLNQLGAAQFRRLSKYALDRIMDCLRRYHPGEYRSLKSWRREFDHFMLKWHSRHIPTQSANQSMFGRSLLSNAQRTGHPLPLRIRQALGYLESCCLDQVGLFRRSGVRSRVRQLQQLCDTLPATEPIPWQQYSAYDIADLVKLFFRQLPQSLFTHRISQILLAIHQYLPGVVRDECLQLSLLLLPDVHRQAVFYLLLFLNRVAQSASINQMGAHNLAVCLTPSLMASTCRQTKLSSPQRRDSFSIGRLMNRPRRKFSTMDRRRSRAEALDPTPTTPNNSLQPVSGCSNYSSPHIASPSRRRSLQWLRHLSSSNPQASPPPLSSLLHSSPRMTGSDNQVASAVSEKVSETGVVRSQHLGCSSAVDLPCLPSTNPLPSSLSWPSVPFPSSSGREFGQARTGCACLSNLILQAETLSLVSDLSLSSCRFISSDLLSPPALPALSIESEPVRDLLDSCFNYLDREMTTNSNRGWLTFSTSAPDSVQVSCKRVDDDYPLRLWRCTADVEAPPKQVVERLLFSRSEFDPCLVNSSVLAKLGPRADVVEYVESVSDLHSDSGSNPPCLLSLTHDPRVNFRVLRAWKEDLPQGACALVSLSVQKPTDDGYSEAETSRSEMRRGFVLTSHYMIQPGGVGRTRITHFSRVDFRGLSVEWYNKVYGHWCAAKMDRLRSSFQLSDNEGRESRV